MVETDADVEERVQTFFSILEMTRSLDAMLKWKTVTVTRAFQWADSMTLLSKSLSHPDNYNIIANIVHKVCSSCMVEVYNDSMDVVTKSVEVSCRAILTSDFLTFHDNAYTIFLATIKETKERIGSEESSRIVKACLDLKQAESRLYRLQGSDDISICAVNLLDSLLRVIDKSNISSLFNEIKSRCATDFPTFLISAKASILSPDSLLTRLPLDLNPEQWLDVKSIQRELSLLVFDLIVENPLRADDSAWDAVDFGLVLEIHKECLHTIRSSVESHLRHETSGMRTFSMVKLSRLVQSSIG